jgi:CRISPR/Cas system-associated endonuclease/helicase Cas3
MESGREYWVRQVYKMRDINGKYEDLFHKLLLQLGKFSMYIHMTPDTFKYISTRNQEWLMKPNDVIKCTQTVNKALNNEIT